MFYFDSIPVFIYRDFDVANKFQIFFINNFIPVDTRFVDISTDCIFLYIVASGRGVAPFNIIIIRFNSVVSVRKFRIVPGVDIDVFRGIVAFCTVICRIDIFVAFNIRDVIRVVRGNLVNYQSFKIVIDYFHSGAVIMTFMDFDLAVCISDCFLIFHTGFRIQDVSFDSPFQHMFFAIVVFIGNPFVAVAGDLGMALDPFHIKALEVVAAFLVIVFLLVSIGVAVRPEDIAVYTAVWVRRLKVMVSIFISIIVHNVCPVALSIDIENMDSIPVTICIIFGYIHILIALIIIVSTSPLFNGSIFPVIKFSPFND